MADLPGGPVARPPAVVRRRDGLPDWYTWSGGVLSIPAVAAAVLGVIVVGALLVLTLGHVDFWGIRNRPTEIYGFSLVCALLSLWLLIGPAFAYITGGQAQKIEAIHGFYSSDLIARYFEQFWSGRDSLSELVRRWRLQRPDISTQLAAELEASFAELFDDNFGMRVYLIPTILLAAVGFIVLFFGFAGGIALAESMLGSPIRPPVAPLGLQLDLVSVAAIFGAYTWVVSDSITRNHQWTFHPSDLSWYALRLIVAVPMGQAIAVIWRAAPASGAQTSGLLGTGTGAFLAFVISMFSLDGITQILSNVAAKAGMLPSTTPDERNDVIVKLPGVDEEKARALRTEGVTTIAQLITVDPIRTSIRTGLPFEYVLSLIDAAMLWRYFGTKLDALREFGFIGASQVVNFARAQRPVEIVARARETIEAATDLEASDVAVGEAAAALDRALAALGPPTPAIAQAQAELQQLDSALAAAPAGQTPLQPRRPLLEAAIARGSELQRTMAARGAANDTFNLRKAALCTAAEDRTKLVDEIVKKTGLTAEGIGNAIAELAQDSYVDFIRRLLAG